eukprot:gene23433-biopygen8625
MTAPITQSVEAHSRPETAGRRDLIHGTGRCCTLPLYTTDKARKGEFYI